MPSTLQLPAGPRWSVPLSHLEPRDPVPMCAVCPVSQDPSGSCLDGCEVISDLVFIRRHLVAYRGSAAWRQARLLVGRKISALAWRLTGGGEVTLTNTILRLFCPGRLRATAQAASGLHLLDVAIRAVPASAVLFRFGDCLDYVCRASAVGRWPRTTGDFRPHDLLARMVSLAQFSHPWRPPRYDESPLFSLVLNEARSRLGMAQPDRRLVKRVHKHLGVCLRLVGMAAPHDVDRVRK